MNPPPPLLGVRVLLVDDNDDARELYQIALQQAGAEVRTACDAKDAVRTLLQWPPPHVVVSDLGLPGTDGLDLLREVRSIEHLARVPAIAITAMYGEKLRTAALAAGFQEHASKPLGPAQLVALVTRWASPSAVGAL